MNELRAVDPVLFSTNPGPVDRADLVTAPPDFVGLGAMKAGTTWLQAQLMAHPEVFDIGQKELHFFDWFTETELTDDHVAGYHARFARPSGMLAGEFTPRYMVDIATAPLLRRCAPDTRLLVMLRDPVARIDSHLRWPNTGQAMLPMFKLADAVHRCHYHQQLVHLLGSFPREQLLVLQYERILTDPTGLVRDALVHIGVGDTAFVPPALEEPVLRNPRPSTGVLPATRAAVVHYLRPEMARLAADFGDVVDLSLWPDFADLAR